MPYYSLLRVIYIILFKDLPDTDKPYHIKIMNIVQNKKYHKCLVTGAAGFIGSHLAKRLLDEGKQVVLVDDFSRGTKQNLLDSGIQKECKKVDLRNYNQLQKHLEGVDIVFHMATRIGSIEYLHGSTMAELLALQTNLVIDANVFKACLEKNVMKIVYASSIAVYPIQAQAHPDAVFSEDDIEPISPDGGYGWAKLMAEIELTWIKNIDIGIARISNIYGENVTLGETAQVIPALVSKAVMYPKEKFVVWGDGEQTRDFLYVADCVEALLRLEKKAANPPTIVNIGSGEATRIKTIAEKVAQLSGKNPEVIYDATKPVGPIGRRVDISRAQDLLGWRPTIGLDEGLLRTYSWVRQRLGV
jgi:GDP-D-mannose 3',5'-epimerase